MRLFYNGIIFNIQNIQFDLIGQRYSLWVKQYRILNFWRRENKKIGIESKDVWIYINTNTPHIAKLMRDGKDVDEICEEIKINIRSYIDYAINNKNLEWVSYTTNEPVMFMDKLELQEALDKFEIKKEDYSVITAFKAY